GRGGAAVTAHPLLPRYGWLRSWAHRHGIARLVNATHSGGRLWQVTVETALPVKSLARYAARDPIAHLAHPRALRCVDHPALLRDQHGVPVTATQVANRLRAHLGVVWMRLHDLEEFGQASRVEVAEQDLLYWVAATRPSGGGA